MENVDDLPKEIIDDFCQESYKLLDELEAILQALEEKPEEVKNLENFGQIIDRMMGAAKTLNFKEIGNICELGKVIGYKSSQVNDIKLVNIVTAILFDAVDLLRKMITKLETGNNKLLDGLNLNAFSSRLKWLSEKFKNIDRASCKDSSVPPDKTFGKNMEQNSIDDLLNSLGL